jgi:hypothetical protein
MRVLNQLATALNRRDEIPNKELAQRIVDDKDEGAVEELIENLGHKDKNIQSDCIKVLDEISERCPGLTARYYKEIGILLESKNNRLVWGAMSALDGITLEAPKGIYNMLAKILQAADKGSVITKDHAVGILIKLASLKQYANTCMPLLMEQLASSPNNQFPMYAEKTSVLIDKKNKEIFREIVLGRLKRFEKESQKKRVIRVLKLVENR